MRSSRSSGEHLRNRLDIGIDAEMGQHDAFRFAGAAAAEDDGRKVIHRDRWVCPQADSMSLSGASSARSAARAFGCGLMAAPMSSSQMMTGPRQVGRGWLSR